MTADLDTRSLRCFVAAAEELSLRRGAERLGMPLPSLSARIRSLEARIGAPLLTWNPQEFGLTPAGRSLLQHGRSILAATDAAMSHVRRVAHGQEGRLRFGFIHSVSHDLLPRVGRDFHMALPHVVLDLLGEYESLPLARAVVEGDINLGFLRPCGPVNQLRQELLCEERLHVALPDDHPAAPAARVSLASLAGDHHIRINDEGVAELYAAAYHEAGIKPLRGRPECRTALGALHLVAAGKGVALVPEGMRELHVPGVVLRPLADVSVTLPLLMVWRAIDEEPLLLRAIELARSAGARRIPGPSLALERTS